MIVTRTERERERQRRLLTTCHPNEIHYESQSQMCIVNTLQNERGISRRCKQKSDGGKLRYKKILYWWKTNYSNQCCVQCKKERATKKNEKTFSFVKKTTSISAKSWTHSLFHVAYENMLLTWTCAFVVVVFPITLFHSIFFNASMDSCALFLPLKSCNAFSGERRHGGQRERAKMVTWRGNGFKCHFKRCIYQRIPFLEWKRESKKRGVWSCSIANKKYKKIIECALYHVSYFFF